MIGWISQVEPVNTGADCNSLSFLKDSFSRYWEFLVDWKKKFQKLKCHHPTAFWPPWFPDKKSTFTEDKLCDELLLSCCSLDSLSLGFDTLTCVSQWLFWKVYSASLLSFLEIYLSSDLGMWALFLQ